MEVRVPFADVTLGVIPPGCSHEAAILVCDNLPTGWAAIDLGAVTADDQRRLERAHLVDVPTEPSPIPRAGGEAG